LSAHTDLAALTPSDAGHSLWYEIGLRRERRHWIPVHAPGGSPHEQHPCKHVAYCQCRDHLARSAFRTALDRTYALNARAV